MMSRTVIPAEIIGKTCSCLLYGNSSTWGEGASRILITCGGARRKSERAGTSLAFQIRHLRGQSSGASLILRNYREVSLARKPETGLCQGDSRRYVRVARSSTGAKRDPR